MKTNHTPGQWITENPDNRKANFAIYTTEKPEGIANVYPGDEAEANARLIAAAPNMLETLRYIVEQIEATPDELDAALLGLIKIKANRAIQKATNQ